MFRSSPRSPWRSTLWQHSDQDLDQAVVKFGVGVKEEEANNQRRAYELLNPSAVRIPRVYRFSVDERFGYLVMEYMKGQVLDPLDDLDCIYKIVYMLAQLAEINSCIPAHLVVVDHVVFFGLTGKYFPLVLSTIWKDFSIAEYHEATRKWHLKITGSEYAIHDVAPRNILWLEDGSICLLDWKSAGFYPRILEVCMQRINVGMDGHFNELLLASMERLTDKEEAQAQLVLQAYSNGIRYYL